MENIIIHLIMTVNFVGYSSKTGEAVVGSANYEKSRSTDR